MKTSYVAKEIASKLSYEGLIREARFNQAFHIILDMIDRNLKDEAPLGTMAISEFTNKVVHANLLLQSPDMGGKNFTKAVRILQELKNNIPALLRRYDIRGD